MTWALRLWNKSEIAIFITFHSFKINKLEKTIIGKRTFSTTSLGVLQKLKVNTTMKSQTIAVSISVSLQKVYAFASNPKNLPQWAPSTVKEIQRKDNKWIVPSPDGPVEFAFVETNSFGVLDHKVRLPSGEELYNPMRVFANGAGSEVTFTLFQHQGMSDQQFQKDAAHVLGDLQTLRQILESASE